MLSRLQLPKSSICSQGFPAEMGCCPTTARPSPVARAALRATPGLERDDRSTVVLHNSVHPKSYSPVQKTAMLQIRHLLNLIRRAALLSSRPAPPTELPCYKGFTA